MPIEGGKPYECFDQFREHIAQVVSGVLSDTPPILVQVEKGEKTRAVVAFAGEQVMPLATTHGDLQLFLGQAIEAYERDDNRGVYTLRTNAYWYRLHWPNGEELLRWEYLRDHRPETPKPPRNHVHIHGAITPPGGGAPLELKKLHLPTGWATFEEVIRFLITDLGVAPKSDDWPKILTESEKLFRNQFVPRGPWPPSDGTK